MRRVEKGLSERVGVYQCYDTLIFASFFPLFFTRCFCRVQKRAMDTAWGFSFPFLMITSIVTGLALTYLGVMKLIFGTFSLNRAVEDYKHSRRQEGLYRSLFEKRESIVFHMDWAKSRGEQKDVKKLQEQLQAVEEEMDVFLRNNSSAVLGSKAD